MYGFRKPFTAAAFAGATVWGIEEKTLLVAAQVLGYALAKCLGIRVISAMPASRRGGGIVALIAAAELTLALFSSSPRALAPLWMFLNGMSLGMVFGLVVGFLEGRRVTEALAAGRVPALSLPTVSQKPPAVGCWNRGSANTRCPRRPASSSSTVTTFCLDALAHSPARCVRHRPAQRTAADDSVGSPGRRDAARPGPLFHCHGVSPGIDCPGNSRRFALEIARSATTVIPSTFAISEIVVRSCSVGQRIERAHRR